MRVQCKLTRTVEMIRMTAAFAFALLLTGCFISDRPMFSAASTVQPLQAGRYGLVGEYGDPNKPSEYMEVKLRPDGGYDFINEKGAVNPVTFHPIRGGLHVAQVGLVPQRGTDKKGYGYAIFQIDGRQARVHVVECGKQDSRKLIAAGVVIRGEYECAIDAIADPAAFFSGLQYNEPATRMMRE
jgi:hypothetical protein